MRNSDGVNIHDGYDHCRRCGNIFKRGKDDVRECPACGATGQAVDFAEDSKG